LELINLSKNTFKNRILNLDETIQRDVPRQSKAIKEEKFDISQESKTPLSSDAQEENITILILQVCMK